MSRSKNFTFVSHLCYDYDPLLDSLLRSMHGGGETLTFEYVEYGLCTDGETALKPLMHSGAFTFSITAPVILSPPPTNSCHLIFLHCADILCRGCLCFLYAVFITIKSDRIWTFPFGSSFLTSSRPLPWPPLYDPDSQSIRGSETASNMKAQRKRPRWGWGRVQVNVTPLSQSVCLNLGVIWKRPRWDWVCLHEMSSNCFLISTPWPHPQPHLSHIFGLLYCL